MSACIWNSLLIIRSIWTRLIMTQMDYRFVKIAAKNSKKIFEESLQRKHLEETL